MSTIRQIPFLFMAALALAVAGQSLKFTTGNPAHFSPEFAPKYLAHLNVVRAHGVAAITLLALGPLQFLDPFRRRFPRVHRVLGRVYLVGILVASITGFRMGLMAHGGPLAEVAFCTFAVMWLLTGAKALERILRRDIVGHRAWMIRNFALTFGAVTLRVYLNFFQWLGQDFDAIYVACAWAGWIPNMLFAEWLVARHAPRHSGLPVPPASA